jgi:hypothetical protein
MTVLPYITLSLITGLGAHLHLTRPVRVFAQLPSALADGRAERADRLDLQGESAGHVIPVSGLRHSVR